MKYGISLFLASFLLIFSSTLILSQTPIEADDSLTPRGLERVTTEVRERVQDRIETAKENREEIRLSVQQRLEDAKEDIAEQKEQFRERLSEIKDERKQAIVERLDTRLQTLNEKFVQHANNTLTRLTLILDKIEERASTEGISLVTLSDARAAIDIAQGFVNEQAGKSYVFEIGDENTLGEDVSSTIIAFKSDIQKMNESVRSARQVVQDTLQELKSLVSETQEDE